LNGNLTGASSTASLSNITSSGLATLQTVTLNGNLTGASSTASLSNITSSGLATLQTVTLNGDLTGTSSAASLSNITSSGLATLQTVTLNGALTGMTSAATLSNMTLKGVLNAEGNITTLGTLTASNLNIIGQIATINTTTSNVTSNTQQLSIENNGTGPALRVTQVGSQPVATFIDKESGTALIILDTGLVGINTTSVAANFGVAGNAAFGAAYANVAPPTDSVIVSGNIGVGTTTPAARLDVAGNVAIGGTLLIDSSRNLSNVATITSTGVISTTSFVQQKMNNTRCMTVVNSASYTTTGAHNIGFTIAWTSTTADQKNAFKINTDLTLISNSNVSMSDIESLVNPTAGASTPNGLLVGNPETTYTGGLSNAWTGISMTITRVSDTSVNVDVNFTSATVSTYNAIVQMDLIAPDTLGNFTFTGRSG
jgi:hypothetical protein